MATLISHSPEETEALGESWGRAAESGWVIALCGDLGAGKTQLVQGLARGLSIPMRVHSPTFALVNVYTGGRLTLFHLDLYRLDTPEQMLAAGLEEYLRPSGVTAIEWAEKWGGGFEGRGSSSQVHLPRTLTGGHRTESPLLRCAQKLCCVRMESLSETERRIEYEDFGA